MANYSGRFGAPMIQPTKDDLRTWLAEARHDLKKERIRRKAAEFKLEIATRKLGELMIALGIREEVEVERKRLDWA